MVCRDRMRGFRRRDKAFRVREQHRGAVALRLWQRDRRSINPSRMAWLTIGATPLIAQPAGMDRLRHKPVSKRVHCSSGVINRHVAAS